MNKQNLHIFRNVNSNLKNLVQNFTGFPDFVCRLNGEFCTCSFCEVGKLFASRKLLNLCFSLADYSVLLEKALLFKYGALIDDDLIFKERDAWKCCDFKSISKNLNIHYCCT